MWAPIALPHHANMLGPVGCKLFLSSTLSQAARSHVVQHGAAWQTTVMRETAGHNHEGIDFLTRRTRR